MTTSDTLTLVRYENPAPRVARIVLARADKHNAINPQLIYEVNSALDRALRDDSINVIILAADGKHFSAGHDITETVEQYQQFVERHAGKVGTWSGFTDDATYGWYAAEREAYFDTAQRWRNIPKPMIAQVQGKCVAGALIFVWVCDVIVAAKSASFSDPVVGFGVSGVEWFAHPWELGPRKAKELLFTADAWSADEAHSFGMVNHVVADESLAEFTLAMADKIAAKPAFALKLAKEAVNRTLDIQGQTNALHAAFSLHHLCHAQNFRRFGWGMDPTNVPALANAPRRPGKTVKDE